TSHDGFLGCTTDEALNIRSHGHARAGLELDAVAGDRINGRATELGVRHIDELGIHRGLHGVEDVATGEVDRAGGVKWQLDLGFARRDESVHDTRNATAGEVVGFELVRGDGRTNVGLHSLDSAVHDDIGAHLPEL